MNITVCFEDRIIPLTIDSSFDGQTIKALIEAEVGRKRGEDIQ